MPLTLAVVKVALARTPCRTRLPFRFGAVTVREAELLTCRVSVRDDRGCEAEGWSGDLLVPRWFRKDTAATPQQDADELHAAAEAAALVAVQLRPGSAFALWQQLFAARVAAEPPAAPDLLVRGFGVALIERALLDGACRLLQLPFAEALRRDGFGFAPGEVHAELGDWAWQDDLPNPSPQIVVRHTVGMLDVLLASDLDSSQRVDDGLPQTLDEDVARLRFALVQDQDWRWS